VDLHHHPTPPAKAFPGRCVGRFPRPFLVVITAYPRLRVCRYFLPNSATFPNLRWRWAHLIHAVGLALTLPPTGVIMVRFPATTRMNGRLILRDGACPLCFDQATTGQTVLRCFLDVVLDVTFPRDALDLGGTTRFDASAHTDVLRQPWLQICCVFPGTGICVRTLRLPTTRTGAFLVTPAFPHRFVTACGRTSCPTEELGAPYRPSLNRFGRPGLDTPLQVWAVLGRLIPLEFPPDVLFRSRPFRG